MSRNQKVSLSTLVTIAGSIMLSMLGSPLSAIADSPWDNPGPPPVIVADSPWDDPQPSPIVPGPLGA